MKQFRTLAISYGYDPDRLPAEAVGDVTRPCSVCRWPQHLLFNTWSCAHCVGTYSVYKADVSKFDPAVWYDCRQWRMTTRLPQGAECDHDAPVSDFPCPVSGCAYGLVAPHQGMYLYTNNQFSFYVPEYYGQYHGGNRTNPKTVFEGYAWKLLTKRVEDPIHTGDYPVI